MGASVVFIGAGWVVERCWLPACAEIGVERVALLDVDPERTRQCIGSVPEGSLDVARVDDPRNVSADIAVIATPAATRIDAAKMVMPHVGRVVLEKPAALDTASLEGLIELARQTGTELAVANTVAYRPDVLAFAAEARRLEPSSIDLSWFRRDGVPRRPTFLDPRQAGGGAVIDLGWHLLDAIDQIDPTILTGALVESATSDLGSPEDAHDRHLAVDGTPPVAVEFKGSLLARCRGGASLSLQASWLGAPGHDMTRLEVTDAGASSIELTAAFGFSPDRARTAVLTVVSHGVKRVHRFENTSVPAFRRQAQRVLDGGWRADGSCHDVRRALDKVALFEATYSRMKVRS